MSVSSKNLKVSRMMMNIRGLVFDDSHGTQEFSLKFAAPDVEMPLTFLIVQNNASRNTDGFADI